mmetsp:Transcript_23771/g.34032  ORF Transcript_23771/g.34032 Transcript_23771/m.34032 type:complete len:274 (-) Transcript_23771:380-1201(-)
MLNTYWRGKNLIADIFPLLGFKIQGIFDVIVRTATLMTIFYIGPLLTNAIMVHKMRSYDITNNGILLFRNDKKLSYYQIIKSSCTSYWYEIGPLIIFRNIIFAPLSEELVFRSILIPSLYIALIQQDPTCSHHSSLLWTVIWISPLWFGFAHIHHLIEKLSHGIPLSMAFFSTTIQFTYTTFFGFIATILFMRTGSILSSLLSHMICNVIGLPDLSFYTSQSGFMSSLLPYRYLLLALHALGLIGFGYLLFPLTEELAKTSIYWNPSLSTTWC